MFWQLVICSILLVLLLFIRKRYFGHQDCMLMDRLDGKLVIVTGSNSGIGRETVAELARRGARVVMACRDLDKGQEARSNLLARYGIHAVQSSHDGITTPIEEDQLILEQLDLSSIDSIRQFCTRLLNREPEIHILVNNAALNLAEPHYSPIDGIEEHVRVNYLGHFLLTELLLPGLERAAPSRILNVSSLMHLFAELDPSTLNGLAGSMYANSKLLNVMHARSLALRLARSDVVAVSLHPGFVKTQIYRYSKFREFLVYVIFGWLAKSSSKGAQTTLYCALADDLKPGAFYCDCQIRPPCAQALDDSACAQVYETSQTLITKWEAMSTRSKSGDT